MPSQSVTSQNLPILLCKIGNNISGRINKITLLRLNSLPLLSVLGNKLSKLLNVISQLAVGRIAEISVIDS